MGLIRLWIRHAERDRLKHGPPFESGAKISGEAFIMNLSCTAITYRICLGARSIAALLAALLVLSAAGAQQPGVKPVSRPKVALVFEGGGALGFAHIGVIEWIEAHHIPVDYVAGTSMGGLVGGLYASGLSPQEI